ncbi:MAG: hypothetical protein AAF368_12605, partial [Planctomycetota bacterium]
MRRILLGALSALGILTASTAGAQLIPHELLTEDRAGAIALTPEMLEVRLGDLLAECRAAPDPDGIPEDGAHVTCALLEGLVHGFSEELEPARLRFSAALDNLEQRGDHLGIAFVHFLAAEVERQSGDSERAGEAYDRVFLALDAAAASKTIQLDTFELFFRLQGMPPGAVDQFRQVAQFAKPMIVSSFEVAMRMGYAKWLGQSGSPERAIVQLEGALEQTRGHLFGLMDADVLNELSRWHFKAEHFETVRTLAAEAITSAERMGNTELIDRILWRKANAERSLGLWPEAIATLEDAL